MNSDASSPRLLFRVVNNTGTYLAGDIFYRFIGFLSGVLIIRSLGSEAYGQYSFIYVFLMFFENFVDFGLNNIVLREAAQRPEETPRLLGNAILLRLLLAAFSIPLSWFLVSRLNYPLAVRFGVTLASFQLLLVFRALFEIVFRLKLMMIWPVFWNGVRAVLNLLFVAAAFFMHAGVPAFILAALVSGFISMGGLAWFSLRFTKYSLKWNSAMIRRLILECWPIAASSILTSFCLRMDVMFLSKIRGFAEVGYYNAALRLTEAFGIAAVSLMASFYPLLSEAYARDRAYFEKLIRSAYRVLLLACLPLAVGGLFTAKGLIVLLFGPAYASSGTALAVLLWYLTAYFIGILFVNILYACRRQIVDVQITFLQILAALGLNFILIPRFGFNGAALATAAGGFFAVMLMMFSLARFPGIKISLWAKGAVAPLAVNAAFFAVLFILDRALHWPPTGMIPAGVFVYAGLLFLFRIVSFKAVREYFRHTLRKRGGSAA